MKEYYEALESVPEELVRVYSQFADYRGMTIRDTARNPGKEEGLRGFTQVEALILNELNNRGVSNIPASLHEDLMKRNVNLASPSSGPTLEGRISPGSTGPK